jgi:hypothetical protein
MKGSKFVDLMRTLIREEVRKAIKQEMPKILNESKKTIINEQPVSTYNPGAIRNKYSNLIQSMDTEKPQPVSGKSSIEDLLMETAKSAIADGSLSNFREGLG